MEDIIGAVLGLATSGNGTQAVPVLLGLVIWHLLGENKKLKAEIEKKDERIDKIVDDYHRGNLTLTEALNSLKLVLFEIKGKI